MNILISAGCVYGRLDDNKLVGNRVRGIWACKFAGYLASKGHFVSLLVPDTMPKFEEFHTLVGEYSGRGPLCREGLGLMSPGAIEVIRHNGYESYAAKCYKLALTHDAAVMAAAVVNWIPKEPFAGKMPTKGYKERDEISIPFYLAPRVINRMKALNPKITLIGCKMLSGSTFDELIDAAYHVVLDARCNVVVANDMQTGLRGKHLVYQDRTAQTFDNDFEGFFKALEAVVLDEHYRTVQVEADDRWAPEILLAMRQFDRIVDKHRDRFVKRTADGDKVFGAVAVQVGSVGGDGGWLVSPREKGSLFTSADAVWVRDVHYGEHLVKVAGGGKATLNAPLLIRVATLTNATSVLHLHEQLPDVPTLPYAPPGTVRDSNREILFIQPHLTSFNIEGHGFVTAT